LAVIKKLTVAIGAWQTRHRDLVELDAIDAGLLLVVRGSWSLG
jgi:hypothetical protein